MAIKSLYISIITALLLCSCEKPETPVPLTIANDVVQQMRSLTGDPPPVKNYIAISIHKRASLPEYADTRANGTAVTAAFYSVAGTPVSVGNIHAGDITVSPAVNGAYSYVSNMTVSTGSREASGARVMDLPTGQDIVVSVDGGNGYGGFSQTVGIPADFNLNTSAYNTYVKDRPFTMTWTRDLNNQFGYVLINVMPYPGSGANVPGLSYLVPDDGAYTIPASIMNAFPANSFFSYSIARANEYEVDPVNDIIVYTINQVSSDAILVIPSPGIYAKLEVIDTRNTSNQYVLQRENHYALRFYQTRQGVPLELWSDLTVYISGGQNENDISFSNWEETVVVPKGTFQYDLGWREVEYTIFLDPYYRYTFYSISATHSYDVAN